MPPPRRGVRSTAVAHLLRLDVDGAYIGSLTVAPGVDARAVTDLVAGATRRRRALDYALTTLAARPVDALAPALRAVLRAGLHELAGGAPAHSANEYVTLARSTGGAGAAGIANAVLRRAGEVVAATGALPAPNAPSPSATPNRAALRALAIRASHPDWMVRRWVSRYGWEAAVALMDANNAAPHFCVRAADGASSAELAATLAAAGATVRPSNLLPDEFVVVDRGMACVRPLLTAGAAAAQDDAAAAVVALAAPTPGQSLLDACAAPGGKALFAAARMGGVGRLVARDASDSRLAPLRAAAAAAADRGSWPPSFFSVEVGDGRAAGADHGPTFDTVLIDAPCTGTGVLSKRADLRWRRAEADVATAASLQAELLAGAAGAVKPGGVLVYSTCSLEPEENEGAVASFLASPAGAGFAVDPPPPGALPAAVVTEAGFLMALPHVHGTDGAFGARLRRVG
jgi:16S rRNA (cytosine967-C5)-methyltransferase